MRRLAVIILLFVLACGVWPCSAGVTSIQQLNNPAYSVGVSENGAPFDAVKRDLPNAKRVYVDMMQGYEGIRKGKFDAYAYDRMQMNIAIANGLKGVKVLPGHIGEPTKIAVGISRAAKIDGLREKVNALISELRSNGTLQDMYKRWTVDGNYHMPDIDVPEKSDKRIIIGTSGVLIPYTYYEGDKLTGYDIELGRRLAKYLGAKVEFRVYDYAGIVAAAATGEIDCIMANLNITPERTEKIDFSDVLYTEEVALAVKDDTPAPSGFYSVKDLDGKRIAVLTGTIHGKGINDVLPSAEVFYFDSIANMLGALTADKVDAMTYDDSLILTLEHENSTTLKHIDEYLQKYDNAFILAKSPEADKLRGEVNEFVRSLIADGTLDELRSIWLGFDESKKIMPDYENYPATNGVLKIATDNETVPFSYVKDGRTIGYDIDIIVRFCKAYGYRPEIVNMNFSALIPAVQSSRCNIGVGGITITPERAESVNFTDPIYFGGALLLVKKSPEELSSSASQPNLKRIGVQTGTTNAQIAAAHFPTAVIDYFETIPDMLIALRNGKVDALCAPIPTTRFLMMENKDIMILGEPLTDVETAPIFPKTEAGRKLCDEYSEFIKPLWEDGTLKALDEKWFSPDDNKRTMKDYSSLPAPNGTLKMAADISLIPFAFIKDNRIVGYDVELAAMFCEKYGYGLEVMPMSFGAIIPAVQSGKCDFAACTIAHTEERAESVLFSYRNARTGNVIVVMKQTPKAAETAPETTAIDELKASFERTFMREERWRLFVEGIINTMIITVLSIICGTILGFIVYLSCRNGNIIANLITRFCVWLIQGTPMVVLLMILYYIIFGKVDIGGIWVAVIAFTLTFGSSVYAMLCSGVNALDKGQTEAAYALGFTDRQTFLKVILPQAALHFMPAYKAEVVALIKATAIVGYIAVQDLTKMGDIVRSRTYEAFFPLIAVAAIYFVLAGLLNVVAGIIHNRIRPEKRTRNDILRGIDTHD